MSEPAQIEFRNWQRLWAKNDELILSKTLKTVMIRSHPILLDNIIKDVALFNI